jgi:hypothetical protein
MDKGPKLGDSTHNGLTICWVSLTKKPIWFFKLFGKYGKKWYWYYTTELQFNRNNL